MHVILPMLTSRSTKKANSSHDGEAHRCHSDIYIDHRIEMGRRMCSPSDNNAPMQMS